MSIKVHELKKIRKRVRIGKIAYPKKIEADYYRELKQISEAMKRVVLERLLPMLQAKESEYTADGVIDDLMLIFEAIRNSGSIKNAIQVASEMVRKVDDLNRERVLQQLNQRLGVDIPQMFGREGIEPIVKANIAKNATLIKSIPEEFVKNIESIIYNGVSTGATYKSIENQIKGVDGITSVFGKLDNRIKLIARNEVSSINGQINKKRMQSIGLDIYEWAGAMDERERESHRVLESKICSWSDPTIFADSIEDARAGRWRKRSEIGAVELHPGEDYLCRCQSIAVIEPLKEIEG